MSAIKINSLEEDIKSARIAGALMRSEEKGKKEGIKEGNEKGVCFKAFEIHESRGDF